MATKKELKQKIRDLEDRVRHLERGIDVMILVEDARRERREFLDDMKTDTSKEPK